MRRMTQLISPLHFNWSWPLANVALSSDEVHVWATGLEQTGEQIEHLTATLSPDEQARAARFHFKRDRDHFVCARGFMRKILSYYTGKPAEHIAFAYGKNGKPALAESDGAKLNFNLSHSAGLAICAIAKDRDLGIDLEKIVPCADLDDVATRCFPPEEQRMLQILQPPERETTFFRFWTRKEAELKCSGEGISSVLARQIPFDGSIVEMEPASGYLASLAVRGKPFKLQTWHWPAEQFQISRD